MMLFLKTKYREILTGLLLGLFTIALPLAFFLNIGRVFADPLTPPDSPITPPDPLTPPDLTPTPTSGNTGNNGNNGGGGSNSSGPSNHSYCGEAAPVDAPYIFQVKRTRTTAKVYFKPSSGPVTYYFLAYGTKIGDESYGLSYSQGYSGGALSVEVKELSPNKNYYFHVRAGNGCMPGPWSNWYPNKNGKTVPISKDVSVANKTSKINSAAKTKPANTTGGEESVIPPVVPVISESQKTEPTTVPVIKTQPTEEPVSPSKKTFWQKLLDFFGI
jgi:hypothetical protein